jgi:hypothetical protein
VISVVKGRLKEVSVEMLGRNRRRVRWLHKIIVIVVL